MKKWFEDKQLIGNAGIFYVSYKLTTLGWNVLITSRNTKGPDMVIISRSGKEQHTVQIKSSIRNCRTVNVGNPKNFRMSDFAVLCVNLKSGDPSMYISKTTDFILNSSKAGHYIKPKDYIKYKNNFKVLGTP